MVAGSEQGELVGIRFQEFRIVRDDLVEIVSAQVARSDLRLRRPPVVPSLHQVHVIAVRNDRRVPFGRRLAVGDLQIMVRMNRIMMGIRSKQNEGFVRPPPEVESDPMNIPR